MLQQACHSILGPGHMISVSMYWLLAVTHCLHWIHDLGFMGQGLINFNPKP